MIKSELTKLIEAINTATSMNEIELIWVGDKFFLMSNDMNVLTILYLFITQCTFQCVVSWEKDQDTCKNYLKGWML